MANQNSPSPDSEVEEIDVTQIIERLERVEKDCAETKQEVFNCSLQERIADLENSLDLLVEKLEGRK